MEFDYEIQADDYTAAQILYYKLIRKSRRLEPWFLGGFLLLVVALVERDRGLSPVLVGAIGLWWMWAAIARRFPGTLRRSFRKHYDKAGLSGKKYRASIDEGDFRLMGRTSVGKFAGRQSLPRAKMIPYSCFIRAASFLFLPSAISWMNSSERCEPWRTFPSLDPLVTLL